jgi:hypothetical protein
MASVKETAFVTSVYQNILFRSDTNIANADTQSAIAAGAALIDNGTLTEMQMATMVAQSAEATAFVLPAIALYGALLRRAPDPAGLAVYVHALESGASLQSLAAEFIQSPEFMGLNGPQISPTDYVNMLFQWVLGRTTDSAGLSYWVGALGGATAKPTALQMASVALDFIQSPEAAALSTVNMQNWLVAGDQGTYPNTVKPTYTLLVEGRGGAATEGSSLEFLLETRNLPTGTHIPYTISGVTASQVQGGALSGTITVNANGNIDIPITLSSALGQGLQGSLTLSVTPPSNYFVNGSQTAASVPLYETSGLPFTDTSTGPTPIDDFTTTQFGMVIGSATGGTAAQPTGPITAEYENLNGSVAIYGGSTVTVYTESTGPITIGNPNNSAADPTGDIRLVGYDDSSSAGTAPINVITTNGSRSVTVQSIAGVAIADAKGVSPLASLNNVTLDSVGGYSSITTGAQTLFLEVASSQASSNVEIFGSLDHNLNLSIVGFEGIGPYSASVTDRAATSITIIGGYPKVQSVQYQESLTLTATAAQWITFTGPIAVPVNGLQLGTVSAGATAPTTVIAGASSNLTLYFGDFPQTLTTLGTQTGTLTSIIAAVDALPTTVAHSITTFQFGGDTYVLETIAAGTGSLHAGDSLIQLVGLHTLSAPTNGYLHLQG